MSTHSSSTRLLPDGRIDLPEVTLLAVSSLAITQTLDALRRTMHGLRFAEVLFFTDAELPDNVLDAIDVVPITRLCSIPAYSHFMLNELASHIRTPFALCVQWDGFVLDPANWRDEFLDFDYIGAPWPHLGNDLVVGNGGFSLRSRRLLQATARMGFDPAVGEDLAICRHGRAALESEHGIRFAPASLALQFAYERTAPRKDTLGFHGVFNMPALADFGDAGFLEYYRQLPRGLVKSVEMQDLLAWAVSKRQWRASTGIVLDLVRCGRAIQAMRWLIAAAFKANAAPTY